MAGSWSAARLTLAGTDAWARGCYPADGLVGSEGYARPISLCGSSQIACDGDAEAVTGGARGQCSGRVARRSSVGRILRDLSD